MVDLNPGGGDSFEETSSTGWLGRIAGSFMGILFGLILIIGAVILLFWNEGRTVNTARALNEAAHNFVALRSTTVNPANEGKLVYVSGDAATSDILTDNSFGVSINAIRLERNVQIFQWKEEEQSKTEKKLGGGTTTTKVYRYSKVWENHLIGSSGFKKPEGHANPVEVPFSSQGFWANKVTLGAFNLPRSLIEKLDNFEPLPVEPAMVAKMSAQYKSKAQIADNYCYLGNPQAPAVGDLRVSFQVLRPGPVSIVAMQVKDTFEPYEASSGKQVELIKPGVHSPQSMFAEAKRENSTLAWVLRGVGALAAFIGIFLILNPISVLLDVVPFLGSIAGAGIGLVSFVCGAVLSLLVISIAWLRYRPFLSIGLLCLAVLVVFLVRTVKKRGAATQNPSS